MAGLPPPPLQDAQGSFGWLEWYRQLRDYLSTASSIPWNIIQFAGSKLTDIQTRLHGDLQSIQGGIPGERYHLTAAELAAIGIPSAPVTKTADFTVAAGETWFINNKSGSTCTVTLPTAGSFTGRSLTFKNLQPQLLVSASSNVVPIDSTTAGTAILLSVAGNWATMVSNGTNWVIMQQAPNNILLLE
jgi:hypothetical protein